MEIKKKDPKPVIEHAEKAILNELYSELVNKNFDVSIDYGELFIDTVMEHEVLKEIPLAKTVVAVGSAFASMRDKANLLKLFVFLKEVHKGSVTEEERKGFNDKLQQDAKWRKRALEHVLLQIDRIHSVEKAEILGRLFMNHIRGAIDWPRFMSLSVCLENIHPDSFSFFEELSNRNWIIREQSFNDRDWEKEGLLSAAGLSFTHGNFFTVHKLGQDLYEYGIKPQ